MLRREGVRYQTIEARKGHLRIVVFRLEDTRLFCVNSSVGLLSSHMSPRFESSPKNGTEVPRG